MKKETLIKDIANKTGKTNTQTKKIIDDIFDEITVLLSKQKSLNISGFGTFSVVKRDKRKGFNPTIEKFMMLPPKLKAKFKPSEILKDRVNKNGK